MNNINEWLIKDLLRWKEDKNIAFDVDGTLFYPEGNEKPNKEVFRIMKVLLEKHNIVVHSGGGKEYAEQKLRSVSNLDGFHNDAILTKEEFDQITFKDKANVSSHKTQNPPNEKFGYDLSFDDEALLYSPIVIRPIGKKFYLIKIEEI